MPDQTVPSGTVLLVDAFLGTSCQATIMLSLWDENLHGHLFPGERKNFVIPSFGRLRSAEQKNSLLDKKKSSKSVWLNRSGTSPLLIPRGASGWP
jgi:hypothetical protein